MGNLVEWERGVEGRSIWQRNSKQEMHVAPACEGNLRKKQTSLRGRASRKKKKRTKRLNRERRKRSSLGQPKHRRHRRSRREQENDSRLHNIRDAAKAGQDIKRKEVHQRQDDIIKKTKTGDVKVEDEFDRYSTFQKGGMM